MADKTRNKLNAILREYVESDGTHEDGYFIFHTIEGNMEGPFETVHSAMQHQMRQDPTVTKNAGLLYCEAGEWYIVMPVLSGDNMVGTENVLISGGLAVAQDKVARATKMMHELLGPDRMFDAGAMMQAMRQALENEL
jgi:hypothetical protein